MTEYKRKELEGRNLTRLEGLCHEMGIAPAGNKEKDIELLIGAPELTKVEIPPDALGLNWGTLTKVELWEKAKELGIIDELPPYAKATKKEIAEAVELKEKE